MNAEIFAALRQLEKERGIPVDYMVEKITQALVAAYKKDRDGYTDNVYVELTEDAMRMYAQKEVVDEVMDDPERSLCWVEAENRKHSIRALLAALGKRTPLNDEGIEYSAKAELHAALDRKSVV